MVIVFLVVSALFIWLRRRPGKCDGEKEIDDNGGGEKEIDDNGAHFVVQGETDGPTVGAES